MERSFFWKVGFIVLVTLGAIYCLIPTFYYFQLPPDERNEPEKLQAALPSWAPSAKTRLNLGLDLQGGIHLVLGVDVDAALRAKTHRRADQVAGYAREQGFNDITTSVEEGRVVVKAPAADRASQFQAKAVEYFQDMFLAGTDNASFTLAFQDQFISTIRGDAVDQALKVISNRVNRWGVTEPIIAKRGDNAILVQLPGFKDPARAKELLGKTAQLEFRVVDDENPFFRDLQDLPAGVTLQFDRYTGPGGSTVSSPFLTAMGENARQTLDQYLAGKVPQGYDVGYECIPDPVRRNACQGYRTYLLRSRVELTGDQVVDARALLDQSAGAGGKPYVSLTFDQQGARDFER
ncbi:MAG: SecDF P1 head subdomain-containing protein, partial [Myxococcales bacterium]